jgi:lysophospholipase L1-like esterase
VTRGRERLARLALVLASVAGILLVLEAFLRAAGYTPERFRSTGRLVDARWRVLLDCYPTNPRGYFDIDLREPGMRERYQSLAPHRYDAVVRRAPHAVEFRYNALRFRDVDPAPRPAGVRRIAVVGDSFTEGQGVKEPDTYPRVLERLLRAGGGAWEVRNCGRRGIDFPELGDALEDALLYEPDVVILGMVLNDGERSPEFQARQSYVNDWILDRGHLLAGGREAPPFGRLDSRLAALVRERVESYRIGRDTARWYREMYGAANREGWERTQADLKAFDRRMRERGGRFVVATWPLLVDLEADPFADVHQVIATFCDTAGILHHDLRPALRARASPELWVHPVDMHPNEVAHRLAAESLASVVRGLP